MLTITCVLWQAPDSPYHPFHVKRLRDQCLPYVPADTRFVCLSNAKRWEDEHCKGWEIVPLQDGNRGWWAKLELFRPGLFTERVLYLDLDVEIVGDLAPLFEFDAPFAAIDDYENRRRGRDHINSSVMVFDPGMGAAAYTPDPPVTDYSGDQAWILDAIPDIARFPFHCCMSFKWGARQFGVTPETAVVVYHGRPKPWEPEAVNRRADLEMHGMFPLERRLLDSGEIIELDATRVEPHDFARYRERVKEAMA